MAETSNPLAGATQATAASGKLAGGGGADAFGGASGPILPSGAGAVKHTDLPNETEAIGGNGHGGPAPAGAALSPEHLAMLRDSSSIADAVILARGYRTVTDAQELAGLGFSLNQRHVPGILIPLWTPAGQRLDMTFRPDNPRVKTDKRKGTCKPVKYETKIGQPMRIDCPPACRATIGDPSIRLWITEGVRKVDALASRGLTAVALLGVDCWKGKNELGGKTVLADWGDIALNGRRVCIAFDSDSWSNNNVRGAADRLTEMLRNRGAIVERLYLHKAPDGSKVGVDDYFAAGHTREELEAAIEAPKPVPTAAPPRVELLDEMPARMSRPLAKIDDMSYVATWLPVRVTVTEGLNKAGEVVRYDPPIVRTERMQFVMRGDGQIFADVDDPAALPLADSGLEVVLPEIPPAEKLWSTRAFKAYRAGARPDPVAVHARVASVIDTFIDFSRSLADQATMCDFVACYVLATWLLDAFHVAPYLWPNGDRGVGKTQLLSVICHMAYLGQLVLAGGTFASLRDLSDYGACLGFDDAEKLDDKTADPDKRTLLLAGNRRGNSVSLKELAPDKTWRTRYVQTFCPRMFSAIAAPDAVLASRSIVVPLIRTPNKTKANADPEDLTKWPHNQRTLIDDLWALGLAYLPEVGRYDTEACARARLQGRPLEPWRAILAVALWLESKGAAGLFGRIEALSWAYQTERPDLERRDLTTLVIRALLRLFVDTPARTTCTRCTTCTSNIGDSPEKSKEWPFRLSEVKAAIVAILEDEGEAEDPADVASNPGKKSGAEWVTEARIGRAMARLRFRREQETQGKKRPWYRIVGKAELINAANTYGLTIPASLSASGASGSSGASGACESDERERI